MFCVRYSGVKKRCTCSEAAYRAGKIAKVGDPSTKATPFLDSHCTAVVTHVAYLEAECSNGEDTWAVSYLACHESCVDTRRYTSCV